MILFLLPRRLRKQVQQSDLLYRLLRLGLITLLVFAAYTVGFVLTERSGWDEALWQAWQTGTTVGYGNAPAETTGGRWVSAIFGSLLIALVGAVIALAFDIRVDAREQRKLGMKNNPHTDGYVIFHFPGTSTLTTLIQELRSVEPDVPVCIVDHQLDELPGALTASFKHLHFVRGSMLEQATYERAGLRTNRAVIVFPEDANSAMSDAQTRTILDIVLDYIEPSTRLLYFLQEPRNAWLFNHLDPTRATPVIMSLEVLAAVQECQDPQSAILTQKLLRNTDGEFLRTVKPGRIAGRTWGEFCRGLLDWSTTATYSVTPLALIGPDGPDACPAFDAPIAADHLISIVARDPFDWSAVEQHFAQPSPA